MRTGGCSLRFTRQRSILINAAGRDVNSGVLGRADNYTGQCAADRLSRSAKVMFTATRSRGSDGEQLVSAPAPVARRIRGYFAPVNRAVQAPILFDPAEQGGFNLDTPRRPDQPGVDPGFHAEVNEQVVAVADGIPAAPLEQVRETLGAQSVCSFLAGRS